MWATLAVLEHGITYRPVARTWPFLYNSGHTTYQRAQKAVLEDHLYGLLYVAAALYTVNAVHVHDSDYQMSMSEKTWYISTY